MVGYIAAAVKKEGSWSRSMIPFWHKYQYMKQSWLLTSMVSGLVWGGKKTKTGRLFNKSLGVILGSANVCRPFVFFEGSLRR